MPIAIVLSLRAQHDGAIYGATGQHAHGFFLNSWRAIAAEVGDALHDDRPLRQFTVSPLMGLARPRHGQTVVMAGDRAALRITALDWAIEGRLLAEWPLRLPAEVTIGGVRWRPEGLALAPADDPDAGCAAYAELRERGRGGERPSGRWRVAFETPMAFHLQNGAYLPFPLPERLIGGWLTRWNEFAPRPLPEAEEPADFLERVAAGLRVSQYDLRTVSFRFWRDGPEGRAELPQIGCVGALTLDGAGLRRADRAIVGALVDFSFYCGAGHHTTMGMGQTRPRPVL